MIEKARISKRLQERLAKLSDATSTAENTLVNEALDLFLDCYDLLGRKPDLTIFKSGLAIQPPPIQQPAIIQQHANESDIEIIEDVDTTDGLEECF